jgi:hypothetical protein
VRKKGAAAGLKDLDPAAAPPLVPDYQNVVEALMKTLVKIVIDISFLMFISVVSVKIDVDNTYIVVGG